jgi:hypothetical protein
MNGARFAAALVFPVGITTLASQIFISDYNQLVLLVVNQALASAFCFVFSLAANNRRGDGLTNQKDIKKNRQLYQSLVIFLFVYVGVNTAIILIPSSNSCSIAKCFVLEVAFGRRDQIFSILYMVNILESFFLVVLISVCSQLYGNLRGDKSLRDL